MKAVKICAVFFFLIFLVGDVFALNQLAGVDDGKLCLSVRADDQKTTTQITPIKNVTNFYSAKVMVKSDSYVESGATGAAALGAWVYNDSYGPENYNGVEGDVWLDIRIVLDADNTLRVGAGAYRCENADCSTEGTIFEGNFTKPIAFDTEYTLSIQVAYPTVYFRCDEEVLSYDLTGPIYPSNWDDRRIMSRIYAGEGQSGYFSATFDDVCIDEQCPYDTFEGVFMLDEAKWDVVASGYWWFIQRRKKEDGSDFNRILFALFYNNSICITGDVVDAVELYDSEGAPIVVGEKKYWVYGENSINAEYDCNASRWDFDRWGAEHGYDHGVDFNGTLQPETYYMLVKLKDGQEFVLDKDFGGIKELPIIPSDSFYLRQDSEGNAIWTWDIPEGISQDWDTSVRAYIEMFNNSGESMGSMNVKVPTHLGRVFIPSDVVQSFEARMSELGAETVKLCVQLRTNDNCNRSYSNSITLEEAEDPPAHCDVNGDGKTGLAEAIHALQVVSGSR